MCGLLLFLTLLFSLCQPVKHLTNQPQATVDTLTAYRQWSAADSLRQKGQFKQAIINIQAAQRLYQLAEYPERVMHCLVKYARILDAAGQQEQRLLILRQAQDCASKNRSLPMQGMTADVDMQLAEVYIPMHKPDSVVYYINRAQPVFSKLKNWEKLTYCNVLRGVNAYYTNNFNGMELALSSALKTARQKLPLTSDTYSVIYQLQGVLYDAIGDYERAIITAQNGLRAKLVKPHLTSVDSSFIVSLYNNIGAIYYGKGDYDRTLDYYTQALQHALQQKSTPSARLLSIYQNIGLTYHKEGKEDKAMEYYMRSLEYSHGAPSQQIALIYLDLCAYFISQKNSRLAAYYLKKGKALQPTGQPGIELYYLQKGNYYALLNLPQQALLTYQLALKYATLNQKAPIVTIIWQKMSEVYLQLKDYQQALRFVEKGLRATYPFRQNELNDKFQYSKVGDRLTLLELLYIKTNIFQQWTSISSTNQIKQQRLQTTHRLNQTVTALVDTLRLDYPWEEAKFTLFLKASPFYKAAMETALQLYQLTGNEAYVDDAFSYAEKNRATILLETIVDARARQNETIPSKVWDDEKRFRINLTFYTSKLIEANAANDSSLVRRYQQYLFENRRKLEALSSRFQKNYPLYYQVRHSLKTSSTQTIQDKLKATQATFIEYAEGASDLFAFYITPTSKRFIKIGKTEVINQQVNRLRSSLTDYTLVVESSASAYTLFTQSAHQLYNSLIKQVLPKQGSFPRRLVLVPTGSLNYVPFDNLLDSLPISSKLSSYVRLPYLLRKTAISYAYSATLFADEPPTKSLTSASTLLAFAPTYLDSSKPQSVTSVYHPATRASLETPLSETQQEVKQIARHFKGQTYLNQAATKRQFMQVAEDYDLIHVAMHSTVNQKNPDLNALIFAPEKHKGSNKLAAYEVASLRLKARIAVLSGCETGYGIYQAGEGVLSLARSFMLAGSQSVVMSLWKAEDRASATIMDAFYKGLAAGLPKDEALRQAKITYIDQSDELTGHPMFWSGIVIIGEVSSLIIPMHNTWLWVLLTMVLALFVGLTWRLSKPKASLPSR